MATLGQHDALAARSCSVCPAPATAGGGKRGEGRIRRLLTLITLIVLALPGAAEAHSHYWLKVHPWRGTDWKEKALCVHRYEGSWTDPDAPYWGGMQMDLNFQAAYGPWMLHHFGTADHWPKNGQLYASYKAWLVRGWSPWPTTGAMCGLL